MLDPKRIILPYPELVEWMIKKNGIHKGIWGLYARFGLSAINTAVEYGEVPPALLPTAVIPLIEIGLQEYNGPNDLALDAAVVNPGSKVPKQGGSKKKGKK